MVEVNEPVAAPIGKRTLLSLWLGCWLAFLCVAHGNLESTDSAVTMQAARALWLRGDSGLLQEGDGAEWLAEGLLAHHIVANAPNGLGKTGTDGRHQYVWFPIGHVYLMVPAVAIGESLARWFPGTESAFHARATDHWYHEGQFVLDQAMIATLIPPAVGASTILLLWLIARAFGCSGRQALLVAAAIECATQCLATARETISNGPGLVFLLGAVLALVRCHLGTATWRSMLLGGMAAGAAVLCRYQQATLLLPIGLGIALACWQRRRLAPLLWFGAGGLPFALLLLLVDRARFGDPFTTGYPPLGKWLFDSPLWFGLMRMLFAGSKGILWLSPLLWLCVPAGVRRGAVPRLRWFAWTVLLLSTTMFASMGGGWQSGQCWGSRYVTDAIVVFAVIVLAQARPWQRWPRCFALVVALGVLVNLTQVVAPVRGHAQLAAQGTFAYYEAEAAAGRIGAGDLEAVRADPPDRFYLLWRFSVLHANWSYAWQSLCGRFELPGGQPWNGAERTIQPLFGVGSADPQYGAAPSHWEDRNFRHLACKFWGDLTGWPWWLLLSMPAVAAGAMLSASWRRLSCD